MGVPIVTGGRLEDVLKTDLLWSPLGRGCASRGGQLADWPPTCDTVSSSKVLGGRRLRRRRRLEKTLATAPDCLILDLDLPRLDGLEVSTRLRDNGVTVPVLMPHGPPSDTRDVVPRPRHRRRRLPGQPVEMEELLARVRTLLRRPVADRGPVLRAGGVDVDTNTRGAQGWEGRPPSRRERDDLLEYLLRDRGVAHDRLKLIEDVWGGRRLLFSQTVDVHVAPRRRAGQGPDHDGPGEGLPDPRLGWPGCSRGFA